MSAYSKKSLISYLMIILLSLSSLYAQKFQIDSVEYIIDGSTKIDVLTSYVEVDTTTVFESEDALKSYIRELKAEYDRLRNFESVEIKYKRDYDIKELYPVSLVISLKDSKHLLVLPYPKYDSSTGLSAKIKMKDSNFLGNMAELSSDVFFASETEDEDSVNPDYKIGFDFNYNMPFSTGIFSNKWINDYGLSYTIGRSYPEYNIVTGIESSVSFDNVSLVLLALQRGGIDFDYTPYGDEIYFGNTLKLSLPVKLLETKSYGDVTFTPYVDFNTYYDNDGINADNIDFAGPKLKGGLTFDTGKVYWSDNFRNGILINMDASYGWNFQINANILKAKAELFAYNAFRYNAVNMHILAFYQHNGRDSIGEYLRGIKDQSHYAGLSKLYNPVKSQSAIVLNMDFPFHLMTWDWRIFTDNSFLNKFNFEVQFSPFVDIGLTYNEETKRLFSPKDGFYTGGFEFLVYPQKWKSIVVRASAGFDVGRLIIANINSDIIDVSWRKSNISPYEIYIGIGLLY